MLAHASTAQFTFVLFGSVSKWLGNNAWFGFILGLAILALAVAWPEIQNKIPSCPKTPGERFRILEEHVPVLSQNHLKINKRVEDIEKHLESVTPKLKWLEECHQGSEKDHGVAYVMGAHARDKVNVFGGAAIATAKSIPSHVWLHIRMFDLVREWGDLFETFDRLRNMHGTVIAPAIAPFSSWRPKSGQPIADLQVRDWEWWARMLSSHYEHCVSFSVFYGVHFEGGDLFYRIRNWDTDASSVSGDEVRAWLEQHGARLKKLREDYAAKWSIDAEARFTTS